MADVTINANDVTEWAADDGDAQMVQNGTDIELTKMVETFQGTRNSRWQDRSFGGANIFYNESLGGARFSSDVDPIPSEQTLGVNKFFTVPAGVDFVLKFEYRRDPNIDYVYNANNPKHEMFHMLFGGDNKSIWIRQQTNRSAGSRNHTLTCYYYDGASSHFLGEISSGVEGAFDNFTIYLAIKNGGTEIEASYRQNGGGLNVFGGDSGLTPTTWYPEIREQFRGVSVAECAYAQVLSMEFDSGGIYWDTTNRSLIQKTADPGTYSLSGLAAVATGNWQGRIKGDSSAAFSGPLLDLSTIEAAQTLSVVDRIDLELYANQGGEYDFGSFSEYKFEDTGGGINEIVLPAGKAVTNYSLKAGKG